MSAASFDLHGPSNFRSTQSVRDSASWATRSRRGSAISDTPDDLSWTVTQITQWYKYHTTIWINTQYNFIQHHCINISLRIVPCATNLQSWDLVLVSRSPNTTFSRSWSVSAQVVLVSLLVSKSGFEEDQCMTASLGSTRWQFILFDLVFVK